MSGITTHILDVSRGRPAAGVAVSLELAEEGETARTWSQVGEGRTDEDGRVGDLIGLDSLRDLRRALQAFGGGIDGAAEWLSLHCGGESGHEEIETNRIQSTVSISKPAVLRFNAAHWACQNEVVPISENVLNA